MLNRACGWPEGWRFQGAMVSVSAVSLSRTPTTILLRAASRAMSSTAEVLMRGCSARNRH